MTKADRTLLDLGYVLVSLDAPIESAIYKNVDEDQLVIIEWGEEIIHSVSITEYKDWFGQKQRYPIGLTLKEMKAFISKIEQFRKGDYDET
ncbi:hypothetical protein [uncultured Eubacterium sp.]|uniref:hypothetical protein n=1 Tax=uncultured Eubacterium sp. TaxID=165185 RepID=UPI0025941797|nr:hypothetical protein [uncultured Eubacterium sp.]